MTDTSNAQRMYLAVPDGAQLVWAAKAPPKILSFLGTTYVDTARALQEVFGKFPIQLNRFEHETILVAMAALSENKGPYAQLLDGLRMHGDIEIRME